MRLTECASPEPAGIGRSLFARIAGRQETAAQAWFLQGLYSSPLAGKAVVCGSAALHGIFLHARRVPTLDLLLPPLSAARFPALMAAVGVTVRAGPIRNRYVLPAGGASIPGLEASVHVHPAQRMPGSVERHTFSDSSGNKTAVTTLPLVDLAADKLNVLSERHEVTDYLDAWLVLTRVPEVAAQLPARCRADSFGGVRPPNAFDAGSSLRYLDTMDDAWWQAIARFTSPVPPLSQVADDMHGWWETFIDGR